MTTRAPSAANRLAVARPIPLLPPVMTATLPSSFFDMTVSLMWVVATCIWEGIPEARSHLTTVSRFDSRTRGGQPAHDPMGTPARAIGPRRAACAADQARCGEMRANDRAARRSGVGRGLLQ